MIPQSGASSRRYGWLLASVAGLSICLSAFAADTPSENAQLAALLRQLDLLERSARESAKLPGAGSDRYHFDYERLYADIARIRAGVQDYLAPRRAQPRDSGALKGVYRAEQVTP